MAEMFGSAWRMLALSLLGAVAFVEIKFDF